MAQIQVFVTLGAQGTYLYWNPTNAVVFRVFTCFVDCSFQDEVVLSVIVAKAARIPAFDVVCWVSRFCADRGSLQSNPDLVSTFILTDLTGSCSRPKNPSKTCAP